MTDRIVVVPSTDAILHVDIQPAFMGTHFWDGLEVPAGGLPVPDGEGILPLVLRHTALFPDERRYGSLDEHPLTPLRHMSFASSYEGCAAYDVITPDIVAAWPERRIRNGMTKESLIATLVSCRGGSQMLWPDHAMHGTIEAELHPALRSLAFRHVQRKGQDPACDSYSPFSDNMRRPTSLGDVLRSHQVRRLFIDGLAFTHCVGYAALDAAAIGFETYVIKDATRPVPIPGLEEEMTRQLQAAGVRIILSAQLTR